MAWGELGPVARIELDENGGGWVDLDGVRVQVVARSLAVGHRTAFGVVADHSRRLALPVAVRAVTPDGFLDVVVAEGNAVQAGRAARRDNLDRNMGAAPGPKRADWAHRAVVALGALAVTAFVALVLTQLTSASGGGASTGSLSSSSTDDRFLA